MRLLYLATLLAFWFLACESDSPTDASEKKVAVTDENLNLNDDELAFYDALEVNDSAVKVLGDDILRGNR